MLCYLQMNDSNCFFFVYGVLHGSLHDVLMIGEGIRHDFHYVFNAVQSWLVPAGSIAMIAP